MIPLYGFLQGDTLGLLVLADDGDTAGRIAERLQQAAAVRVAPRAGAKVVFRGRVLPDEIKVTLAGVKPLDRFDVRFDVRLDVRFDADGGT